MVRLQLDHLVFAWASLQQAEKFSLSKFGIKPHLGGKHVFMGTHNSLIKFSSSNRKSNSKSPIGKERTYLEFISIDPDASFKPSEMHKRRWFGLDDAKLQLELREKGPKMIHFVASMEDENLSLENFKTKLEWSKGSLFQREQFQLGNVVLGSRTTLQGSKLNWSICIRQDGRLLMNGLFPTLIQWKTKSSSNGSASNVHHPTDLLPDDDGLYLKQFKVLFDEKKDQELLGLISSLKSEWLNNVMIEGVRFEPSPKSGFEATLETKNINGQDIVVRDFISE